jgi:protein ImuA
MVPNQKDIIAQLQREIFSLQGLRKSPGQILDIGWGNINDAFPEGTFPLGAIHEFISDGNEAKSASTGFIAGILKAITSLGGACIWVSSARTIFPPALKNFGLEPHHFIFIDLQKERDVLWTIEESLKCNGISAVIGEIKDLSFTASRRLQLAVEQSRVTGFIIRHQPKNLNTTACVTRWKITPLASEVQGGLPGLGFAKWNIELLKVRNGKPGNWIVEWEANRFRNLSGKLKSLSKSESKKAV